MSGHPLSVRRAPGAVALVLALAFGAHALLAVIDLVLPSVLNLGRTVSPASPDLPYLLTINPISTPVAAVIDVLQVTVSLLAIRTLVQLGRDAGAADRARVD